MRPIRESQRALRYALSVTVWVCAVTWVLTPQGNASQLRSITDGVYSARQAERAQPLYELRCAGCHGDALEGASAGPPLKGEFFRSNWSGRPVSELVDKIEDTMPFLAPGSLSRQESTDLTAYMLQAGAFPAGTSDLDEDLLAEIAFPEARAPETSGAAAPGAALLAARGNLSELMRAIAFPNSNIIFNLQVKDPSNEPPRPMPIPFDYVEWGATIYPGWLQVDQAAVALTETAPLLLVPGRRCQNGRPVPVDRADWREFVADLVDVGEEIYQASKARNYDALVAMSGRLDATCANCHAVYRDGGGSEGSGANRCVVEP